MSMEASKMRISQGFAGFPKRSPRMPRYAGNSASCACISAKARLPVINTVVPKRERVIEEGG